MPKKSGVEPNVAVIGAQWGDEGKGKVVDLYSSRARLIVRYQGGNNAGHTLVVNGKKTVLHLIPSGVLHAGKICVIANGVVFDPAVFFEEVRSLQDAQVLGSAPWERLRVSERAHVILPYHRLLDRLREEHASKTKSKIGTTVRGIGPAYEDKVARRGIQVIDLLHPEILKARLATSIEEKNVLLKHHFSAPAIDLGEVYELCLKLGETLRPYVEDTRIRLTSALQAGDRILFEGAQGTLLDVDHGTYPFVTSSNTVAGGVLTGCGVGPRALGPVIGITKAYTTRVGTGPFPTEIEATEKETAERIRKVGAEFGATTGRPRRVGWLDLVALKYAAEVNHLTGLALMKSDCLSDLPEIRVCVRYQVRGGRTLDHWPSCVDELESLQPVYETLPGWKSFKSPNSIRDLPPEFAAFVKKIEDFVGLPVVLLSTGPGREETLEIQDPFAAS